jgi:hypothetical protein
VIDGTVPDVGRRLVDDRLASRLTRGVQDGVVRVDGATEVEDPDEDQDEDGKDDRELDERLAALIGSPGRSTRM